MQVQPQLAYVLGYTEDWFQLGVVDAVLLEQQRLAWESGSDKNPEHYRYSAFRQFLTNHRPLSAELATALFQLGAQDQDSTMGGAMMGDIVGLPECPKCVLDKALATGKKHLLKLVKRRIDNS